MKRKNSISKFNILLIFSLVFVLLIGTMAYFTDRITGTANMSTMDETSLDIVPEPDPSVDPDDPDKDPDDYVDPDPGEDNDLTQWWVWLNTDAEVNFNPGDKMTLSYILKNKGSLAVDVRETFVISTKTPLTDLKEFELFTTFEKDANTGANTGITAVAGAQPVTQDGEYYRYKYVGTPFTMSGSGTDAETIAGKPAELQMPYYLVFNKLSGNDFQGVGCTVDYLVEAKQHTDPANADDWAIAASTTMTFGGSEINVVPQS